MIKKINAKKLLVNLIVPIMFLVITIIAIPLSNYTGSYLVNEIITRMSNNTFLVLSLLIPIMAGIGINFGMVLGAMAGQMALIFITDWGVLGLPGLLLGMLIATPIAILLGYFSGSILNRAKGKEMITSMMLALLMNGVNQIFILYLFGGVIPFRNKSIILSKGYGVKNTLTLDIKGAIDNIWKLKIPLNVGGIKSYINIPVATFVVIALLCIFIVWFRKTKLGQDMRAVGQDMHVAGNAGIHVDKTRIIAIIISTVLAAYGQIIFLQNIGTMSTVNGADMAALYAAAALLIGGATVSKASILNAVAGTALFHALFIVMKPAAQTITGDPMIGEYSRMFISYGIVTTALILHAWKRGKNKKMENIANKEIEKERKATA